MKSFVDRLSQFRRRVFGRYELEDPRPIAAAAPYTFFLPSPEMIAAVEAGDSVKLIFRGIPASPHWGAERMWVTVTEIGPQAWAGTLDNDPDDLPQLKCGDEIRFEPHHIINIEWRDSGKNDRFPGERKQVWDRCLVDRCVIDDGVPIHYLYREEPDTAEADDKYPDSGWRIRGDYRGLSDEDVEAREAAYVALGVVLNVDDSWIDLLESPVGSAFLRDFETGEFVPEDT